MSKNPPIFKIDIRPYSYEPGLSNRQSVDFVDQETILLGWTTWDDPGAAKKVFRSPGPSHLHALILSTRTGYTTARDWAVPSACASIRAVAGGKFLVRTNKEARLLSSEFELLHSQPFPDDRVCNSNQVSTSGRSFVITSEEDLKFESVLIDVESFKSFMTWSREVTNVSFSDRFLAGYCKADSAICTRKLEGSWEQFHIAGANIQPASSISRQPWVVNDSTLVLFVGQQVSVASEGGALLFRVDLPDKLSINRFVTSTGGQRFAIVETRMRGVTNRNLDMYAFPSDDRAVVFDIAEKRAVYARKLNGSSPWLPWAYHMNYLALSPDGTLLAILDDGILSVYQLPARAPR